MDPSGLASPVGFGKRAICAGLWKKIHSIRFELTTFSCVPTYPLDADIKFENFDWRTFDVSHPQDRCAKKVSLVMKGLPLSCGLENHRVSHSRALLQRGTCLMSMPSPNGEIWEMGKIVHMGFAQNWRPPPVR